MKVRWTPNAEVDLDGIVTFIAQDSLQAALQIEDRIIEAVDGLGQFPKKGRPGAEAGTRELVVSGTSYLAIYRITQDVEVLRVLHGAQQWPPAQ